MKKSTILLIFVAFTVNAICQNDTIAVQTEDLTAEEQLFQGSYEPEKNPALAPFFGFSKFTAKNKKNQFDTHSIGLFAGFSNLSTRALTDIGVGEDAELKLSSFEIGITPIAWSVSFHTSGWSFFAGLGIKVQQYNADRNYAFVEQNSVTVQRQPELEILYSKSRLVQWYLHHPIMMEYQIKVGKKSHFLIHAGTEVGLKLSSKSSVVYRDDRSKKVKEKLGRGMNVNPLTLDLKVELGFNDLSLYARYGLIELFRKHRGPEVVPVAVGIIWHY